MKKSIIAMSVLLSFTTGFCADFSFRSPKEFEASVSRELNSRMSGSPETKKEIERLKPKLEGLVRDFLIIQALMESCNKLKSVGISADHPTCREEMLRKVVLLKKVHEAEIIKDLSRLLEVADKEHVLSSLAQFLQDLHNENVIERVAQELEEGVEG